ncbi:nuclear transport factor 2 family protein [Enterococcus sp. HY326]|uniref:nuclear transport factor 2 family protein n=1 Tax=Enterococcus sp. HY326 TaxID=2971265 RepID=UPI002240C3A4|nr:nuclear transport factor 2 family protein [Enterococcus sp. HY326]
MKKSEETMVLMAYRNHYRWMIEADIEKLEQSLAPTFFLQHMSGLKQEKAVWLAEIASGGMNYLASHEDWVDTKIEGEKAELVGRNKVEAIIHENQGTWRLQLKMSFEKINGQWIILQAIASMY